MKVHRSTPAPTPALILLAIMIIGSATGVLWPVNSFLLKFLAGVIVTLFAIPIIASLLWGASTFAILVSHPSIKLFKFRTKRKFVQPHATHDYAPPIIAERPARDEVIEAKWIGIATLTGLAAVWLFSVGWAILAGPNPVIVFSGWTAVSCAGVGLGLSVIAGAYNNDDVGTFGFLVLIAGAVSTALVLIELFALI